MVLKRGEAGHAHTAAASVLGLTLFQLAVGVVNLSLLAPVWMQLIHLLMADAVWIAVLLLVLEATVLRTSQDVPVTAVSRQF
jgi:heme a synthase